MPPPHEALVAAPASADPCARPLGVVTTGMAEQKLWRRAGGTAPPLVGITAGSESDAHAALEHVVKGGARALVSFGVAAALAPAVRPGQLVVADAVVLPDGSSTRTDERWRRVLAGRMRSLGLVMLEARIAGDRLLPRERDERFRRFQATFAAAIDTESDLIAVAARDHGLPLVVVRAVVDSLKQPSLGTALSITTGGRWRRGLGRGLMRPWLAVDAVRAGRNLERALAALDRTLPLLADLDGSP